MVLSEYYISARRRSPSGLLWPQAIRVACQATVAIATMTSAVL